MKLFLIAIIVLLPTVVLAQQQESSMEKFCAQAEKISAIATPYMAIPNLWPATVITPVGPVPSITMFVNENRNPMTDFCSLVNKLKYLKQSGSWYMAAQLANELSADQFKDEIGLVLDIKDISEAVDNASKKGSVAQNVAVHRRFSRGLQSGYKIGMKHDLFSGESGSNGQPSIEQRNQRAQKMDAFARSANRVSVLNETINCKNPLVTRSEGADEFFKENIEPIMHLIDEQEDEAEYALHQLRRLGVMMSGRYEENNKYQTALLELKTKGITIIRSEPKMKRFSLQRKGVAERVELPYYLYSVKVNTSDFNAFEKAHVGNWKMIAAAGTETRGLFAKENKFIKDLRDLAFECRYSKMEWSVRKSNDQLRAEPSDSGTLRQEVLKKVQSCKESFKHSQDATDNLFTTYVRALRTALQSKISMDMMIWNYESEYLGINRQVSTALAATDLGNIAQRKISCDNPLSESDMNKLQNELQSTTVELKGQIAEQFVEKTMLIEKKARDEEAERKRLERQDKINKEVLRRRTYVDDDMKPTSFDNLKF